MIARGLLPPLAAALFATCGCTQTKRLADWSSGGEDAGPDVIAMDCSSCASTGDTVSHLRCALDLCDTSRVLNGDGNGVFTALTDIRKGIPEATCAPGDTRRAISRWGDTDNDLAPRLNGSYAVLATGDWDAAYHSTSCSPVDGTAVDAGVTSEDDVYGGSGEMFDAVEWRLQLRAPADAHAFSFEYVFFSAEYDEAISSDYNDKFYVVIEAPSTNLGAPTVINYTACRNEDSYFDFQKGGTKYCYIAINSALSECCLHDGCPEGVAPTSIAGTGFECADDEVDDTVEHGSSTGWLRTIWPVSPGEEFTLTFHIHDTNDSIGDSAVILDSFQFRRSFKGGGTVIVE